MKQSYESEYRGEAVSERREVAAAYGGGASIQTIAGAGAVVLSILGLLRMIPTTMVSISLIAVGAALAAKGTAFAAGHERYYGRFEEKREAGLGTEFLGGAAGVVLGILALIGLAPMTLIPIGSIAVGAALLFGGSAGTWDVRTPVESEYRPRREEREAATGTEVLIGVGAVVLGILALLGVSPLRLMLISTLGVGAGILFMGGIMSRRLVAFVRH